MARPRKKLDLVAVAETLAATSADRVTMDRLADLLNVAKPTLYRMAGSREELIALSIDAETERLLERIAADGIAGVFRFATASPAGFALLFGDGYPEARPAVRRVENRVSLLVAESSAAANPDAVAAGLLALTVAFARRAMEDGGAPVSERLGSDFDAVAKLAAQISDV